MPTSHCSHIPCETSLQASLVLIGSQAQGRPSSHNSLSSPRIVLPKPEPEDPNLLWQGQFSPSYSTQTSAISPASRSTEEKSRGQRRR